MKDKFDLIVQILVSAGWACFIIFFIYSIFVTTGANKIINKFPPLQIPSTVTEPGLFVVAHPLAPWDWTVVYDQLDEIEKATHTDKHNVVVWGPIASVSSMLWPRINLIPTGSGSVDKMVKGMENNENVFVMLNTLGKEKTGTARSIELYSREHPVPQVHLIALEQTSPEESIPIHWKSKMEKLEIDQSDLQDVDGLQRKIVDNLFSLCPDERNAKHILSSYGIADRIYELIPGVG
jgi:hypothetical protein